MTSKRRPDYSVHVPVPRASGDPEVTRWVRIGVGWKKDSGSVSVCIDALPVKFLSNIPDVINLLLQPFAREGEWND